MAVRTLAIVTLISFLAAITSLDYAYPHARHVAFAATQESISQSVRNLGHSAVSRLRFTDSLQLPQIPSVGEAASTMWNALLYLDQVLESSIITVGCYDPMIIARLLVMSMLLNGVLALRA